MQHNVAYTFLFAAAVCVVCGILVSTSAVSLADRQEQNAALDKMSNVLQVSGLADAGEKLSADEVQQRFAKSVRELPVELATGEITDAVDPATYDDQTARKDPEFGVDAPDNKAAVKRLPKYMVVYEILGEDGKPTMLVLPIEGYGLWSTLYGFLALDSDLETIRGISYYQHGETAGLGGEVDNPVWKSKWPGRKVYGENGKVAIQVIKGAAGPPAEDPYHVDGLSGATLTSNGVTNMLQFWMGENGYGPFLEQYGKTDQTANTEDQNG
jgi:Na+-transporting NADH:ubiquinone oxidoreductase subunit C